MPESVRHPNAQGPAVRDFNHRLLGLIARMDLIEPDGGKLTPVDYKQ